MCKYVCYMCVCVHACVRTLFDRYHTSFKSLSTVFHAHSNLFLYQELIQGNVWSIYWINLYFQKLF